jgi:hypothetical protein
LAAQGGHLAAAAALAAALTAAKVGLHGFYSVTMRATARVHACCWSVHLYLVLYGLGGWEWLPSWVPLLLEKKV